MQHLAAKNARERTSRLRFTGRLISFQNYVENKHHCDDVWINRVYVLKNSVGCLIITAQVGVIPTLLLVINITL